MAQRGPPDTSQVVRAALAHLWFVTIHPFDDGNGRIARAISDMCFARFPSASTACPPRSTGARPVLPRPRSDPEGWARHHLVDVWFLGCLERALHSADASMTAILARARFWHIVADVPINERQIKVLTLLMDDFKGNLTVARWARIAKCSHDTAAQDINDLTGRGILVRTAEGGRSTSYRLVANQCQ